MPKTESSDDLTRWSFPMAKNPFMSAYLSAANRVANTARQGVKRDQAPV